MLNTLRITACVVVLNVSGISQAQDNELPLYKDASKDIDQRVDDLLSRMTLEEKVAQLQTVWQRKQEFDTEDFQFNARKAKKWMRYGIGQLGRPNENKATLSPNKTPQQTQDYVNAAQTWLVENTRLGIPAIHHVEALHGLASRYGTSFPQAIALASTWDPSLIERVYAVAAKEAYVSGAHQALTPILDVARDPRWGRFEETMGEDPYLVAALGLSAIHGFQGKVHGEIPENKILSTLKHLSGHGEPRGGLNIAPTPVGERTLREIFLFPFEVAVKLGGARSVMASYNEIDGIPSHANSKLLSDILHGEWGFDGVVVSDYFAIAELHTRHGIASSKAHAAKLALEAGVDVETPDGDTFEFLVEMVKKNEISQYFIDRAVRRVLKEKFILGLFENPTRHIANPNDIVGSDEHRALAQTVAEKAIILLKNEGNIVPLNKEKLSSIAIIGPHVHEALLGGYSDVPKHSVSILDGMKAYLGNSVKVHYAKGTVLSVDEEPSFDSKSVGSYAKERWNRDEVALPSEELKIKLMKEAIETAKKSDVVLLVLGENEGVAREGWSENHLGDRTSLELFGNQQQLAEALWATGKPVILLLQNGRPLAITELNDKIPVIFEGWYLGQETGHAVARVLFGDVSPSGKLPASIPRSVGHIPAYYNHKNTAKRGYAFDDTTPLYPFGHGLSYTSFKYSGFKIDKKTANVGTEVKISVKVTNSGDFTGEEVVQLYINDPFASVTRPVKELKGFKRITLTPKESKTVTFTLNTLQLGFYGHDMKYLVEPGEIKLMIGSSSADIRAHGAFQITGGPVLVAENEKVYLTKVTTD